MIYKAKVLVCSEMCTKHSAQIDHHVELFYVKPGGTAYLLTYLLNYLLTYLHTYLIIYLLTYLLHGAQSLRS
jgi:lipoprotein signal peptidase